MDVGQHGGSVVCTVASQQEVPDWILHGICLFVGLLWLQFLPLVQRNMR